MASRRSIERAVRKLTMSDRDVRELADKLFRAKRRVYRRSLHRIAWRLGYAIARPNLSDEVLAGLRAEADDHAKRIAETYNRDLEQEGDQLRDERSDDVEAKLRTWAVARQRKRAVPTAITEAYSAHADATLSAFLDLGLPETTTFDFGGHPELGDAPPQCPICNALMLGNPWTIAEVVTIGNPHPGCRQDWHVNYVDQRALPNVGDVHLGQTLAGVVGSESLITRTGGRDQAVAAVEAIRE